MNEASQAKDLVAPVSLLKTLKAIDAGTVTPSQAIEACLQRLALHEKDIHAFVSINGHAAMQAEKAAGPLAGIGIAIKDIIETRTLPTEYNSPIYRGHEPARDAALVTMSRKAGGTVIGKSTTTEFAFLDPGPTRNPHNLKHTPGGSSSGSAAAVAAGMAHLAFGTQTGGSIIRPASYCGVTGYKPSYGLLPKVGILDFSWTLDTAGLFAAGVADCAFAASAITGRNLKVDPEAEFRLPRLGVVRCRTWQEADPDYAKRFEALLTSLRRFGAEVVDLEPSEHFLCAFNSHQIIQDYEAAQSLAWEYEAHPDLLSPLLKKTLDFAQTITPSDYDEAMICTHAARREIAEQFEDIDALLSLSATGPAPHGLATTGSPIFNRIWTLLGTPSINVTGLSTDDGLPLGVQLIGPVGEDQHTLQIAYWLEGAIRRHLGA
jgi:Asp-tRNA(Asn)/Glu-tRNA(Gln) amidotransferase A subunit family amidase